MMEVLSGVPFTPAHGCDGESRGGTEFVGNDCNCSLLSAIIGVCSGGEVFFSFLPLSDASE